MTEYQGLFDDREPETLFEDLVLFNHDPENCVELNQSERYADDLIGIIRSRLGIAEVEAWRARRQELSAASEFGKDRYQDWEQSDDEAVSLLSFILDQLS